MTITYSPASRTADSASLAIGGQSGTRATVALAGTGVAASGGMSSSASAVDFGSVPLGQQAERTVTVTNTGNLPAVVQPPSGAETPFGAPSPLFTGLLNPGESAHVRLTFTPAGTGNAASGYVFRWSDAKGSHALTIPLTGTGTAAAAGTVAIPQPESGWRLNGDASIAGTSLVLTPGSGEAGSAIYPTPVKLDGLNVTFQTRFTGHGDYGLSFALLNPALGDTYVGSSGAMLGFDSPAMTSAGLEGSNTAVTLVTADHSNEFPEYVGITNGTLAGNSPVLGYRNQAGGIPELRTGSHTVKIHVALVSGTTHTYMIAVSLDGVPVIHQELADSGIFATGANPDPGAALLAFTAGTAGKADTHIVWNVAISARQG